MRRLLLVGVLAATVTGCGAQTTINTTPLTEEQKRQIAEEDRRVADEESYGTAGKAKAKAAGKR